MAAEPAREWWKGALYTVIVVECGTGHCNNKDEHGSAGFQATKTSAAQAFRRIGWKHTKRLGWICPMCSGEWDKRHIH